MADRDGTIIVGSAAELLQPATRRGFLRALGAGGSIVLLPSLFAACGSDDDPVDPGPGTATVTLNLATDLGILNYAYMLEQVAATFYTLLVTNSNYAVVFPDANEREVLADIHLDELVHREFYRAALATSAIPDLTIELGGLLTTRDQVLATAQTLEDLDIAAYNGAAKYLSSPTNLALAGKIVSVEARHSAALRDIRDSTGRLFADVTNLQPNGAVQASGLDAADEPADIIGIARQLILTTVVVGSAPTP